jgi:RNA-dependent RNA polymerase
MNPQNGWKTSTECILIQIIRLSRPPIISLDDGLVYVHRILITPCKVYFCGPEINVSNRVLRSFLRYIDNFLRVYLLTRSWIN